jgi:glycosyltransferase involved in cell wall biosynthesis
MITISYITVTYNAEALLQRTLDSVLYQDYPHIRHLIVDGASTDHTLAIVNDYVQRSNAANNSHEVIVTSEPDNGIYDAMNKGLRALTPSKSQTSNLKPQTSNLKPQTSYVCFLNAGDFLPTSHIVSHIVNSLQSTPFTFHPSKVIIKFKDQSSKFKDQSSKFKDQSSKFKDPAVLYGDTDIVDSQGRFLRHRRLAPPERLTWRSFRHGMLVCHQAFYARADLAVCTPYDTTFRYSADVDWCIRIMRLAEQQRLSLFNLHAVVANYTEEGQTTLHHRDSLQERFAVMRRHYGLPLTLLMHAWFVVRALIK